PDLRLLVDGKEVPIDYFVEVADGQSAPPPPLAAGAAPPAASAPPLPPPAAEDGSGGGVGSSYVVFVDDVFAIGKHRDMVLQQIERDLSLLGPQDRMAVVSFDGKRTALLSGWSGDPASLKLALEAAIHRRAGGGMVLARRRSAQSEEVEEARVLENSGKADMIAMLPSSQVWTAQSYADSVGWTASAAAAVLRGLPHPPGRKVMMLLAGGWPWTGDPRVLAPLVQTANLLGYTLYPINVPGMDAILGAAFDMSEPGPTPQPAFLSNSWQLGAEGALKALAKATGGTVALNREDAFRRVVADTRSFYWLGFSPVWKADDHGHAVRVEVRRPGLQVRSRSGYSDVSTRTAGAMRAESLLLMGGAAADRRLAVELGEPAHPKARGGTLELPISLALPVESLTFVPTGGVYRAEANLSLATLDKRGGRATLPDVRLRLRLPAAPAAGAFARYRTTVKLRRAPQRLVLSVQDAASGAMLWDEVEVRP